MKLFFQNKFSITNRKKTHLDPDQAQMKYVFII